MEKGFHVMDADNAIITCRKCGAKNSAAQELGTSIVSVLHVAPSQNTDFQKVTSPDLAKLGETATEVWRKLVRTPSRFISVSTEQLFGNLSVEQLPEMRAWLEYIGARYAWVRAGKATPSE